MEYIRIEIYAGRTASTTCIQKQTNSPRDPQFTQWLQFNTLNTQRLQMFIWSLFFFFFFKKLKYCTFALGQKKGGGGRGGRGISVVEKEFYSVLDAVFGNLTQHAKYAYVGSSSS